MAAKKSPKELKEEGVKLGEMISTVRKKNHNFALSIGKDGLVIETDIRKACDVLWRNAKKAGGGAKGAKGVMKVSGKTIVMEADSDDVPGVLLKLAKKHFSERGQAYKFEISTPTSRLEAEGGASSEEEPEEDTSGARGASQEEQADESEAVREAAEAVDEVVETSDETAAAQEEATAEATGEDAASDSDPMAALRATLQEEFDGLSADIEAAANSANAGAAKKTKALADMFGKQIDGDPRKTASVLSLLKDTLKDVAGETGAASAGAANSGELRAKLDELERSVDELFAELA